MKSFYRMIVFMMIGFYFSDVRGQTVPMEFSGPEILDNSIIHGKLSNGITYYIKYLPESQSNVFLRFEVKAGINHQDSDQLNMAHAVEHMAFESSENFPNGVYGALEQINMSKFDLNGSAGLTRTGYLFDAPPDNKKALETGLLWFKDIATGLNFRNEDLDKERGILIQEYILRSGDNNNQDLLKDKLKSQLVPCSENYSNFFEHQRTFSLETLQKFYKDWYQSNFMAITIVGKIDNPRNIVAQIEDKFSGIVPAKKPRNIPNCDSLFFYGPSKFAVIEAETDSLKINKEIYVELFFRDVTTKEKISGLEGVKRLNKLHLLIDIINNRFRQKTSFYNSFFEVQMEHTFKSDIAPSSLKVYITAKDGNEKNALQETMGVLNQIKKHGATKSEFEEVLTKKIQNLNSIDTNNAKYWLKEIKEHFIYGEALPNNKLEIIKNSLTEIKLEDFQYFIETVNLEIPEDIGIIAPASHQALVYTENQVRSWIEDEYNRTREPYSPPIILESLLSTTEAKKLAESKYEDKGFSVSGTREIKLKNGIKVFLKAYKPSPGVFQEKILIKGFRAKGALAFPLEDYFSAINAPDFIKNSGVGEFDKFDLQRYISSNSLWWHGINLYVKNEEAGIEMDASLKDLEKMLQLFYAYFTEPRLDKVAFVDWELKEKSSYQDQAIDLKHLDLDNNIRKIIGDIYATSQGTERYKGLTETNMLRGYEIFSDLFGDAQDFTFIVTGDFSIDSVIPLINKYLGNLPSLKDKAIRPVRKNITAKRVNGPMYTRFSFPSNYTKRNMLYKPFYMKEAGEGDDWKDIIKNEALGAVLNAKLWELRFEKGYSLYNLGAASNFNNDMLQYEIGSSFNGLPEEFELLRKEFFKIVSELTSELVSTNLLNQSLTRMKFVYDPAGRGNSNRTMLERLYNHYRYNIPWVDKVDIWNYIESLTPQDIFLTAQKYLRDENLFEFVMMKKEDI